ncbi:MAG TPA: HAD family hydrolase [Bryobacteraceae bacterium]|nr:HAD family hydrolase [Bryobacteraceae bacterium]
MNKPPLFEFHGAAILFDMDGTLVDSMAHDERQWTRWAARYGLDPQPILKISHGRRTEETIREVAPHLATEDEFARFAEEELSDREGVRAVPGAAALLRALPRGSWALVTSAPRQLAQVRMECAGLMLPSVVVSADDVKNGKPHPEGVLLAAHLLGVAPAECLVIEDTPAGIQAARAGGMRALGVTTTYSCDELHSEHCIRDFTAVQVVDDGCLHVVIHALPQD